MAKKKNTYQEALAKARIFDLVDSVTPEELVQIIKNHPSLRGMTTGYVSEHWLHEYLNTIPGVSGIYKPSDSGHEKKSDRSFYFKGKKYKVQSKSVLTDSIVETSEMYFEATVGLQTSYAKEKCPQGGTPTISKHPIRGQWDILAVHTYLLTGDLMSFAFKLDSECRGPGPDSCIPDEDKWYYLDLTESLTWPDLPPGWTSNILDLIDATERSEQTQALLSQEPLQCVSGSEQETQKEEEKEKEQVR